MKAFLRTNNFSEKLIVVEVLKVNDDENHGLSKVKYEDEIFYTGGILCRISNSILEALINLTPKEQWELLLNITFPLPSE